MLEMYLLDYGRYLLSSYHPMVNHWRDILLNIEGNKYADTLAKEVRNLSQSSSTITLIDANGEAKYSFINQPSMKPIVTEVLISLQI